MRKSQYINESGKYVKEVKDLKTWRKNCELFACDFKSFEIKKAFKI